MSEARLTDERYFRDLRWVHAALVFLGAAAVGVWLAFFGKWGPTVLDPAPFTGCYRAGDSVVRLSKDGVFHAAEGSGRRHLGVSGRPEPIIMCRLLRYRY